VDLEPLKNKNKKDVMQDDEELYNEVEDF